MKDTRVRNEQIWLAVGSLMVLATVALAAALVYTRDVMIPFVLAVFTTAAVGPMVDGQERATSTPVAAGARSVERAGCFFVKSIFQYAAYGERD